MHSFYELSKQRQLILKVANVPVIMEHVPDEPSQNEHLHGEPPHGEHLHSEPPYTEHGSGEPGHQKPQAKGPSKGTLEKGLFYSIMYFLSKYDADLVVYIGSMSRNLAGSLLSHFPKLRFVVVSRSQCSMPNSTIVEELSTLPDEQFVVINKDPADNVYVNLRHKISSFGIKHLLVYQNDKKDQHPWKDFRLLEKYCRMQKAVTLLKPEAYMLHCNLSFSYNMPSTELKGMFSEVIIKRYFQKKLEQFSGEHYLQAGISHDSTITNFIGDNFEQKFEYDIVEHIKRMNAYNQLRQSCMPEVFAKRLSMDANLNIAYDIIFRVKGLFGYMITDTCDIINFYMDHTKLLNL